MKEARGTLHRVLLVLVVLSVGVCCAMAADPAFDAKVKASVPLAPKPAAQGGANGQVTAAVCPTDGVVFLGPSGMGLFKAIDVFGDSLYVVDKDGKIHGFKIQPGKTTKLVVDKTFGTGGVLQLPDKIESLSVDAKGRLFASSGIFSAYAVDKGQLAFKCETTGFIEIHSSGTWGISAWVNSTVKLVTIQGAICKKEDWVLANLGDNAKRKGPFTNVNSSCINGDTIYIGGVPADKSSARIVVAYDKAGKELLRFGNTTESSAVDSFGWIHAIKGTKTGICVLDSNRRRVTQWTAKGEIMGSIELNKLFDLKYPWMADFAVAKDGTAWFIAAQDREPSKSGVAEGLIYRVKGL